jgi:hypothetical protein
MGDAAGASGCSVFNGPDGRRGNLTFGRVAMIEQWKWVVGYEGLYQVSNLGRITRVARAGQKGKILRMKPRDTNGRLGVALRKGGVARTMYVDRVVMAAWEGPIAAGQTVLHGRAGIADNSLCNLSYGARTCKRNPSRGE